MFAETDWYRALKQVCAGFARGEKIDNLETILGQTDSVRVLSKQEKDRGKVGAQGFYFRYVRLRQNRDGSKEEYRNPTRGYLKQIADSLCSVGKSYGALYFIPMAQAGSLHLNFANSSDYMGNDGGCKIKSVISVLTGLKESQIEDWIKAGSYDKIRLAKWEKDYIKNAEINFSIPDKKKITVVGLCAKNVKKADIEKKLQLFEEKLKKIAPSDIVKKEDPITVNGQEWYFVKRISTAPDPAESSAASSSSGSSTTSISSAVDSN